MDFLRVDIYSALRTSDYFFRHVICRSAVEVVGRPLEKLVFGVDLRSLVIAKAEFGIRFEEGTLAHHFVTYRQVFNK